MEQNRPKATMADHIARYISAIFQPVLLPIMFMFYWWYVHPCTLPIETVYLWAVLFLVFTSFIPAVAHLILFFFGKVDDFFISNRKLRLPINIISFLSLIAGQVVMQRLHAWPFDCFLLGSVVAVGIVMGITLFWKVSAHVAAMACFVTGIICIEYITHDIHVLLQTILIILTAVVGWSRIQLKAHTFAQVLIGACVGIISISVIFSFYPNVAEMSPYFP